MFSPLRAFACLLLVLSSSSVWCQQPLPASTSSTSSTSSGSSPACSMWAVLENKTLPLQDQGHAVCSTNKMCSGFDCKGVYQGKPLTFGMRVLACQDPPGVEIFGSAPQFKAKNFSHVFTHKSEYQVPGALLNLSSFESGQQMHLDLASPLRGLLEVHVVRNSNTTLMMGLVAKGCTDHNTCLFAKTIFNHTEVPVPVCSNAVDSSVKADSVCAMDRLEACGPNMACRQEEEGSLTGICQCLPGFVKEDDGTCLSHEADDAQTNSVRVPRKDISAAAPSDDASSADASSSSGSGGAVAAGVISVLLVLGLAVGGYFVMKSRAGHRLRAMLGNRPYGDILIGGRPRAAESQQNVMA